MLNEYELHELERFFNECQGTFGTFVFTDPADEVTYDDCSLGSDEFAGVGEGELRNHTTLTIIQNR